MISLEQACALCEIFDCTINQLSGFDQPKQKEQSERLALDLRDLDKGDIENVKNYIDFIRHQREICAQ